MDCGTSLAFETSFDGLFLSGIFNTTGRPKATWTLFCELSGPATNGRPKLRRPLLLPPLSRPSSDKTKEVSPFDPGFACRKGHLPIQLNSEAGGVATHNGLGGIVVLLTTMAPKVMTSPGGAAMGNRGSATPEELAAPRGNGRPEGMRVVSGVPTPDGIGPSTVTVKVWLEVLVTNLVTTTIGRPSVTVTVPEQSSCPVGCNRGY